MSPLSPSPSAPEQSVPLAPSQGGAGCVTQTSGAVTTVFQHSVPQAAVGSLGLQGGAFTHPFMVIRGLGQNPVGVGGMAPAQSPGFGGQYINFQNFMAFPQQPGVAPIPGGALQVGNTSFLSTPLLQGVTHNLGSAPDFLRQQVTNLTQIVLSMQQSYALLLERFNKLEDEVRDLKESTSASQERRQIGDKERRPLSPSRPRKERRADPEKTRGFLYSRCIDRQWEKNPVACKLCTSSKRFKSMDAYQAHMKENHMRSSFACVYCSTEYLADHSKGFTNLCSHIIQSHLLQQISPEDQKKLLSHIRCRVASCQKTGFASIGEIQTHCHSGVGPIFECTAESCSDLSACLGRQGVLLHLYTEHFMKESASLTK